MWIACGNHWISRLHPHTEWTPNGPREGPDDSGLARALEGSWYTILPRFRQFLLSIHSRLLGYHGSPHTTHPKRCPLGFHSWVLKGIQNTQDGLYDCPDPFALDSQCTPCSGNWRFRLCSSSYPLHVYWGRRATSDHIPFPNFHEPQNSITMCTTKNYWPSLKPSLNGITTSKAPVPRLTLLPTTRIWSISQPRNSSLADKRDGLNTSLSSIWLFGSVWDSCYVKGLLYLYLLEWSPQGKILLKKKWLCFLKSIFA